MFRKVPDYWDTDAYKENAEINSKSVNYTIKDLSLNTKKALLCGRGSQNHPEFHPRFSTPTTGIDSELYVTVDHSPAYTRFLTRKGNYALCLIVNPKIPKKITELGGKIYWFSPEYLNYGLPQIYFGKNSGLAEIALSSYLQIPYVLLSGIKLTGQYSQFVEGAKTVLENAQRSGTKIFSSDGDLTERLSFEDWCKL